MRKSSRRSASAPASLRIPTRQQPLLPHHEGATLPKQRQCCGGTASAAAVLPLATSAAVHNATVTKGCSCKRLDPLLGLTGEKQARAHISEVPGRPNGEGICCSRLEVSVALENDETPNKLKISSWNKLIIFPIPNPLQMNITPAFLARYFEIDEPAQFLCSFTISSLRSGYQFFLQTSLKFCGRNC